MLGRIFCEREKQEGRDALPLRFLRNIENFVTTIMKPQLTNHQNNGTIIIQK